MKYKLYEYEWYDHYSCNGWQERPPIGKNYLVKSVGYLLGEDAKAYHFSSGVVPEEKQYQGTFTVLKSALKRKKLIKTVDL